MAISVALALPISAQDASPSPLPADPWPSGDELRRELQDIGFGFRIDREQGDWLGWAPRASIVEAPAITLGGAGAADATATFGFDLLQTDLLGGDVDAALTALMEVAARLPLDGADVERTRQFIVTDLLTEAPETLEPCYLTERPMGVILVAVDAESGLASIDLARTVDALGLEADLEPETCAPIGPSTAGPALGVASLERLTISVSTAEPAAFDPPEVTLEGGPVTLVLSFRNDSSSEQSLTFEAPLEANTGPVAPGELKLIVVRRLELGEYPFYSQSDPEGLTGIVRIVEPTLE